MVAKYVIFQEDSKINAKNIQTGNIDYSGIDAAAVINNTLKNGLTLGRNWKEKITIKGNFPVSIPILVPSYTILELQGKLTLNKAVNNRLIRNSDIDNGNTQIEIYGGEIDGNGANQNYASFQTILLQKATYSSIHDTYLHDANWAHIDIRNSNHILVSDIFINRLQPRLSGNTVVGIMILDSRNIKLSGGVINTSDDAIAISNETNNPALLDGINCHDINISNFILASSNANAIRINEAEDSTSAGYTVVCKRILINNITITGAGPHAIQLFRPSAINSFLEDSSINNVTICNLVNSYAINIQNLRRTSFSNIYMKNLNMGGIVADTTPINDVSFININMFDILRNGEEGFRLGSGTTQHRNIKVKDCLIDTISNNSCAAIRIVNVVNGTFKGITVRNVLQDTKGIYEISPSNYNIITENDVSDIPIVSNRIIKAGANTIVQNNIG